MTIAERIAALPAAANTAEPFQAKLTQGHMPQGEKTGAQGTGSEGAGGKLEAQSGWKKADDSRITASLFAVDYSGYTKEDAINKQWRKMNTFNIQDVLDGTVDRSNLTLSASEIERRLREGSLLDEVSDADLSMLKFEFRGVQFHSASIESGEFNRKTDYLASRYAAMEDKIKNIYSGVEQKERLCELRVIYEDALEGAAREYSETVGGILERYGVTGETQKIYESFKSGVEERIDEYRAFLKQNPGFTGAEGTKDAWLAKDDEYVAAMLREREVPSKAGGKSGGYTLKDLDALGQYASGLSAMERKVNVYDMNEERLGLDLAMAAMKTDKLSGADGTSAFLKDTLQRTFEGFRRAYIQGILERLAEARRKGGTSYDTRGFAALDEDSVWKVYDKTMEEYRRFGDVMRALIKGAEFGKSQYSEKVRSGQTNGIYRYQNGTAYWNHFFGSVSDTKNGSYDKTGSAYEQYMLGWLDFDGSLRGRDGIRMNLIQNPAALSHAGQLGSLLNKNA
ncbi:MAG: hypothetical protein HFG41_07030 [Coprococcus sp.]|nr:hypothetical protein [Coprococcus sp.]